MASADPRPSGFAVLCALVFALGRAGEGTRDRAGGRSGDETAEGGRAALLRAAAAVVAMCAATVLAFSCR